MLVVACVLVLAVALEVIYEARLMMEFRKRRKRESLERRKRYDERRRQSQHQDDSSARLQHRSVGHGAGDDSDDDDLESARGGVVDAGVGAQTSLLLGVPPSGRQDGGVT
ncbi:hypothetical protein HK102_003751, partial [Quaeritorhiza haematococci]